MHFLNLSVHTFGFGISLVALIQRRQNFGSISIFGLFTEAEGEIELFAGELAYHFAVFDYF